MGNHNLTCTRKHKSQAVEGMKQEHRIKDSDGSRGGHFLDNIQETTLQATSGDDECTEQQEDKVLKTTGHESREPMNVLVITFTNCLILKSEPKLKRDLSHTFHFLFSTVFTVFSRHQSSIHYHITIRSWFNIAAYVAMLRSPSTWLIQSFVTTAIYFG